MPQSKEPEMEDETVNGAAAAAAPSDVAATKQDIIAEIEAKLSSIEHEAASEVAALVEKLKALI